MLTYWIARSSVVIANQRKHRLLCSVLILSGGAVLTCWSQTYPVKPVRIVTATGSSDVLSRVIAQGIAGPLGQQVIVDSRRSGVIPGEVVAKSAPDGYTVLFYGTAFWIGPLLQNAPYDALKDFSPITLATSEPLLVVVHPALPVKSVKDLIALARARPGELNYASASVGGASQLAMELFKSMAGGLDIVRVSYSNNEARLADMLTGIVPLTIQSPSSLVPFIRSGRLKALAVTSSQRSAMFPDLPTVAASGLAGYESAMLLGMLAPAKTPAAVINRLNQEVVRFLTQPDVKRKLLDSGVDPVGSSPEAFAAAIRSDITRMAKVIRDAGIRSE